MIWNYPVSQRWKRVFVMKHLSSLNGRIIFDIIVVRVYNGIQYNHLYIRLYVCLYLLLSLSFENNVWCPFLKNISSLFKAHVRCQFKHTLHTYVHHTINVIITQRMCIREYKQRTNGREMSLRHFLNAIKFWMRYG